MKDSDEYKPTDCKVQSSFELKLKPLIFFVIHSCVCALNVSLIKRGYKFEEASNLSKGLNCGGSLVKQEENDLRLSRITT